MEERDYKKIVRNTFVGVPKDKFGKKIQSLMYYVFDIGRLGIGNNADLAKCFKNEISYLMRGVIDNYFAEEVNNESEAADLFTKMIEVLTRSLNELLDFMFGKCPKCGEGNTEKKEYLIKRVNTMGERLSALIRQGAIVE